MLAPDRIKHALCGQLSVKEHLHSDFPGTHVHMPITFFSAQISSHPPVAEAGFLYGGIVPLGLINEVLILHHKTSKRAPTRLVSLHMSVTLIRIIPAIQADMRSGYSSKKTLLHSCSLHESYTLQQAAYNDFERLDVMLAGYFNE